MSGQSSGKVPGEFTPSQIFSKIIEIPDKDMGRFHTPFFMVDYSGLYTYVVLYTRSIYAKQ